MCVIIITLNECFIFRHLRSLDICKYLFKDCPKYKVTAIAQSQHVSSPQREAWVKTAFDLHLLPSEFKTGFTIPDMRLGNDTMWNEIKHLVTSDTVSPLLATSLRNLPATFLGDWKTSWVRDDVYWFKTRLEKADVTFEYSLVSREDELFKSTVKFLKSLG